MRTLIVAVLVLSGCFGPVINLGNNNDAGGTDAGIDGGSPVCTPGQDRTCSANPGSSANEGTCLANGQCQCNVGYQKDPSTGLCYAVPSDAGCSSDCRITNCAPPNGWCAAGQSISCDSSTGQWICISTGCDGGIGLDGGFAACTVGQDWTCNDSPFMQSIAGTCFCPGFCTCRTGFVINPNTGKCKLDLDAGFSDAGCSPDCRISNCAPPIGICPTPQTINCDPTTGNWICSTPDGGATVCTPGNNGSCNGDPTFNVSEGTCQANGQCVCNGPYTKNPSTGLCYAPMDFPDAGASNCGSTSCTSSQVCVHPCCGGIPIPDGGTCSPPPPFCVNLPTACGGTASCSCFATDPCSAAGGGCGFTDPTGILCVCA
jgi:hypothetical protein